MGEVSSAISVVSTLVNGIVTNVANVRFNKRICERLARKCQWLEELLEDGDLGTSSNPAFKALEELLTRCDKDMKKFAGSGFLMRAIRSGGIPMICEMHMAELDDWIARIKDTNPNAKVDQDDASADEDDEEDEDDESNQDDAMSFDLRVSNNQKDAQNALLSKSTPARLKERAIVNPDCLSKEKVKVGTFAYGTVYQGTYKGKPVYIRKLRRDISANSIEFIRKGVLLAQCLSDCENIVPIYGFYGERAIVTAMPANGPLNEYKEELTIIQKVTIARKVADALLFMHDISADRKRVIHRDIRAANILLSDNLEPMLTGFEMCKENGALTGYSPQADEGIKRWWSPERLYCLGTSPVSDVYSFGVLMYEISTGKEPAEGEDLVAAEGNRICAEYTALMANCLQRHYNARPTIDKVTEELLSIETILQL